MKREEYLKVIGHDAVKDVNTGAVLFSDGAARRAAIQRKTLSKTIQKREEENHSLKAQVEALRRDLASTMEWIETFKRNQNANQPT